MSIRIGVGVAASGVRAVVVRDGSVAWSGERALGPDQPLGEVLASILAEALDQAPSRRWSRPTIRVAVGPRAVQVKLLRGLPESEDGRLLSRVVEESRRSFFLANGSPLITGSVRVTGPGEAWAAAFEEPDVQSVRDAFQTLGLREGRIIPSAVALPFGAENDHFLWREGQVGLEIRSSASGLEEVRCRPSTAMNGRVAELEPVPALAELQGEAWAFADAYGAATLDDEDWVRVGVSAGSRRSDKTWRRRLAGPAVVGALAIVLAVAAPVRSAILAGQGEAALREFHSGERWEMVGPTLDQVAEISEVLTEIESFASTRTEVTALLGAIARELPDDMILVSLRIEGTEGEVVGLAPEASELLAAFQRLPGLESVQNAGVAAGRGPGGRQVEQVTIRFRVAGRDPSPEGPR